MPAPSVWLGWMTVVQRQRESDTHSPTELMSTIKCTHGMWCTIFAAAAAAER